MSQGNSLLRFGLEPGSLLQPSNSITDKPSTANLRSENFQ